MNAKKINFKEAHFYEIMQILSSYKIMPVNSPTLGFTRESRENDRLHLLVLRKICMFCLDAIDNRYKMLVSNDTTYDIITLNGGATEDTFERFIIYANEQTLQILEEELMECIDKINNLHYEI